MSTQPDTSEAALAGPDCARQHSGSILPPTYSTGSQLSAASYGMLFGGNQQMQNNFYPSGVFGYNMSNASRCSGFPNNSGYMQQTTGAMNRPSSVQRNQMLPPQYSTQPSHSVLYQTSMAYADTQKDWQTLMNIAQRNPYVISQLVEWWHSGRMPYDASAIIPRYHDTVHRGQGQPGMLRHGPNGPRRKRRRIEDLYEHEVWFCPRGCGKAYRKNSTVSIRRHKDVCPNKLPKDEEAAAAGKVQGAGGFASEQKALLPTAGIDGAMIRNSNESKSDCSPDGRASRPHSNQSGESFDSSGMHTSLQSGNTPENASSEDGSGNSFQSATASHDSHGFNGSGSNVTAYSRSSENTVDPDVGVVGATGMDKLKDAVKQESTTHQ